MNTGDKAKSQAVPASGDIDQQALFFHRYPRPGKLEIQPTSHSGISATWARLFAGGRRTLPRHQGNPETAADSTARANLRRRGHPTATAVLGLGNIVSPLGASKP